MRNCKVRQNLGSGCICLMLQHCPLLCAGCSLSLSLVLWLWGDKFGACLVKSHPPFAQLAGEPVFEQAGVEHRIGAGRINLQG